MLRGVKIGHAGTLDPDATGVLVLCLAKATKISAFLMEGEKEYRGTGRLGITTDSQDATGNVVQERPIEIGEDDVRAAVAEFVGEVEQIPPMFSAVKVDGQRLYRLARKGVEVERQSRKVTVHSFDVESVQLPDFQFVVRCTKGTYVRTLLHDLGERLGCGGHLARLVRSRQGTFGLEDVVPWDDLESPDAAELIRRKSVAPSESLAFLPEWKLPATAGTHRTGDLLTDSQGAPPRALLMLTSPAGDPRGVGRATDEGVRVLYLFPSGGVYGRGRRGA